MSSFKAKKLKKRKLLKGEKHDVNISYLLIKIVKKSAFSVLNLFIMLPFIIY